MSIDTIRDYFNEELKNYFKERNGLNKIIYDSQNYSLNIGGKRIRPILCLLTYNMYKDNYERALPLALALEMIHTYSLIHDDLPAMDNDDLRRGKPTNHIVYGEAIAILAGDALLNEACNILIDYSIKNGGYALEASKIILNSSGSEGMIGGQVVDIINEGKVISENELLYMHKKKTGELIKASILSGAVMAGASEDDIDKLRLYGEKLGLAFQVKDDILDVVGNTEILGKKIKSDENNNKTNFITTYGLERCNEICENLTNECVDILESLTVNTTSLKELTFMLLNREN
ncbi:polyprenyl synthetase family protein [Clostridium sp. YIM B02551]|uniref:polyprenyl synthetase family protein n=1 Tax=Clostridium sp. YIM B02551 TaxID=2910679 RepID=UPI001EEA8922|nr:farnesyl diphosphate synthase [Clostridium sp. YIM B02551]